MMRILRVLNRIFLVLMVFFISGCNPGCTPAYDAQITVKSQEIQAPPEGRTAILIPLEIEAHPKEIGVIVQAYLWLDEENSIPVGSTRGQGQIKEHLVVVNPHAHQKLVSEGAAWIRVDVKFVYQKGDTNVPTLMNIVWNEINSEPVSYFVRILQPPKMIDLQFPEHEGGMVKLRVVQNSDHLAVAHEFVCDQSNLEYCRALWTTPEGKERVLPGEIEITIPAEFVSHQRGHFRICVEDGAGYKLVIDKYLRYTGERLVEIPRPKGKFLDGIRGFQAPTDFQSQSWMPERDAPPLKKVEKAKITDLELESWDFINVGLLFVEAFIPGGRIPP